MINTELVLNMLAKEGAKTAKAARQQLEKSTGKPVVSPLNAKSLAAKQLKNDMDRNNKQLSPKSSEDKHE